MPPVQSKKMRCRVTELGTVEVAGTRYKPGSIVQIPSDAMWLVDQGYAVVMDENEKED